MNLNDINARSAPIFNIRSEPVEEVREVRKAVSCYLITLDVSFHIFNDGYMEMEYRGEEPVDPEDVLDSVRREQIFPDTEKYKEILETIKDMVPSKKYAFLSKTLKYLKYYVKPGMED